MPYFGKILPRTGPQFAFTDDFNDDDEALKRLDKGLDTLDLRRWGLLCLGSWCPTWSEMPDKYWPLIGQYWSILGSDWSVQLDQQPGL